VKERGYLVIIVMLGVVVLAATIGTLVVGNSQFDGLVTERPYETGLAWDEMQRQQLRLGWQVSFEKTTVKKGKNDLYLTVMGKDGKLLDSATILLTISRPASVKYDHTYEAEPLHNGRFHAAVEDVVGPFVSESVLRELRSRLRRRGIHRWRSAAASAAARVPRRIQSEHRLLLLEKLDHRVEVARCAAQA
jgi:nitrogen fixation protein FixH